MAMNQAVMEHNSSGVKSCDKIDRMANWLGSSVILAFFASWNAVLASTSPPLTMITTMMKRPKIVLSCSPNLMIKEKWPEYLIPTRFPGIDDELSVVSFSSKKLTDMGFKFKYDLEEMFKGAIDSCREKGLLPISTVKKKLITSNDDHVQGLLDSIKD
ncbi:hypothetical protein L1887_08263 [Cichorium endivia]|nr:hypothetical protein L1887_08263 [Cichorium endivia]